MTEKATFTPGPWEYDQSGEYMTFDCVRHNGMVVCRILPLTYESHGSAEANGRLIAKAPEMFDLACMVADLWRQEDSPDDPTRGIAKIARKLLAEVRGDV